MLYKQLENHVLLKYMMTGHLHFCSCILITRPSKLMARAHVNIRELSQPASRMRRLESAVLQKIKPPTAYA